MQKIERAPLMVCLCAAVLCGCSGSGKVSAAEAQANAQAQIADIEKRTDIPPAAKEQIIGHIQQGLKLQTEPPKQVPGRQHSDPGG